MQASYSTRRPRGRPPKTRVSAEAQVNGSFAWLWDDQVHRYKVLKGGAGAGKSFAACQYLISQFLLIPKCNMIFSRKVANTMRGSVFALARRIINLFGAQDLVVISEDLRIVHRYNRNMIFFIGVDDPEKMKSITAENGDIEKIWMEEASEYDREDFFQFDTRLRGNSGIHKEVILTFNPISEEHWLKAMFFDRKDPRAAVHNSTYRDNNFLSDVDREALERYKDLDPYHYAVYCLGEWGSVGENSTIMEYKALHEARYRERPKEIVGVLEVGFDPARFGDDDSVGYFRRGDVVLGRCVARKQDGAANARMILSELLRYRKGNEPVRVKVDATGLGASTIDALRLYAKGDKSIEVIEVLFGGKAKEENRYHDTVTEMYYEFARRLPHLCLLPDDGDVIPQLAKRQYRIDERTGRFRIEPKDDFKKRIGRSPDHADAMVLAFYEPQNSAKMKWLNNLT